MVVVEPVRHAEQRVAGMRRAARFGQRRPGGVAQRDVQRLGVAGLLPCGDVRGEGALGQRLADPRFQRPRSAGPSKPDGSGYFFTAWRCTNSRLQAWTGSSAMGLARQRQRLRLDAEQRRQRNRRDADRAPPRDRSRPWRRPHRARRVPPAAVHAAPHPRPPGAQERAVEPHQAVTGRKVGEAEAEAQRRCIGGGDITASAHLAQKGKELRPLLGGPAAPARPRAPGERMPRPP